MDTKTAKDGGFNPITPFDFVAFFAIGAFLVAATVAWQGKFLKDNLAVSPSRIRIVAQRMKKVNAQFTLTNIGRTDIRLAGASSG